MTGELRTASRTGSNAGISDVSRQLKDYSWVVRVQN